jgi:DNA-binding CsgD family transcriptional regulator
LPACRNYFWRLGKNDEQKSEPSTALNLNIQIILFAVLLCFFIAYGMHDLAGTAFWMSGESNLVFSRLFIIAGFIVAGIVWDSKSKRAILGGSFGLLSMGFISMALQYKGFLSYVGFSGVQVASAFFGVSAKLLYIDVARHYKRPVAVASLGLVFPIILKQTGTISADVMYKLYGDMPVFLGSLACIIVAMPFVALLFDRINEANVMEIRRNLPIIEMPVDPEIGVEASDNTPGSNLVAQQETADGSAETITEFARKYGFTKRETQALDLSLRGLTDSDMAQKLNISKPAAKHCMKHMLIKTGVSNQEQLLAAFMRDKNNSSGKNDEVSIADLNPTGLA